MRKEGQSHSEIKKDSMGNETLPTVELGEPFTLPFSEEKKSCYYGFAIEVAGLGKGEITLFNEFNPLKYESTLPTGELSVKYIKKISNYGTNSEQPKERVEGTELDEDTSPVVFHLDLKDLNKKQLDGTTATLIIDGKEYKGVPKYDELGYYRNNHKGRLEFRAWSDPQAEFEAKESYFVNDPEVLKKIQIVIGYDNPNPKNSRFI
jgi:hypothetical protein